MNLNSMHIHQCLQTMFLRFSQFVLLNATVHLPFVSTDGEIGLKEEKNLDSYNTDFQRVHSRKPDHFQRD